jgi:phosphate/phosphite/phosphonate ABC transporter binding protein
MSYYPWITQHVPAEEIDAGVKTLGQALEQELSDSLNEKAIVEVLKPVEVPEQIDQISSGQCQIALMNPLGYVFARQHNQEVRAEVVALRIIDNKVGSTYFAQIYARAELGITDPAQLSGLSIGYGLPYSTSNFLIPAFELKKRSLHPLTRFSRIEFLGGHDIIARAVYQGKIDLGAGHDGVIIDLARQPGFEDAKLKLTTIIRSEPIPSDPIAINVDSPSVRESIAKAFVSISKQDSVKKALARFWGNAQGLDYISPSAYDILSKAVAELSLSERDCLRKK